MGVGKSTMGRHLADFLNFRFVDTDELIESRQRSTIPQIFENQGEAHFRSLEQDLVMEMGDWEQCVISTGGGLVAFGDNMDQLKRYAFVVCLWASSETIYQRVKRQTHRPLLHTPNPLETIETLLQQRKPAYQAADLMINTDTRPMRQISQIIVRQFHQAQSKSQSGPSETSVSPET